ncbi:MAG: Gfo/Idh/MocA family oxidoreductase [Bacteroidota bacterium]
MNKRIKLGMIGGGSGSFIGIVHRVAAYMGEDYALTGGVWGSNFEESKKFAKDLELDVDRTYPDVDAFIVGESALSTADRIEAVVILTPNFLHYEMARKLIVSGFHIICEKPVTTSAKEAEDLQRLVETHDIVFALTHTYTGYPMVRQVKSMIQEGLIGRVQRVDAQYYQGWINPVIHEADKRKQVWRLDPKVSGISCCMGDIGVHAFNLIEYTTGLKVSKVLSDLDTLYEDNPLDVDGTVLIRLDNTAKGVIRASQIATGEENNLTIAIYGDKGGLKWRQENPTTLIWMPEGEPARTLKPGNPYNSDFANESTKIAPGHPEGLFDAMGNIYRGAAKAIRKKEVRDGAYPTITDGVRGMKFIEAVVASTAENNCWMTL